MSEIELQQLETALAEVRRADLHSLRRRLRSLRKRLQAKLPADRGLAKLRADLQRSIDRRSRWASADLAIDFDPGLPISARVAALQRAIEQHQVVVVAGETGSGKTTQLPKICLQAGRGVDGLIGVTQPRRIAARSIARRLSEELGCSLGDLVGYQVRFDHRLSDHTRVKLMTDGIALAETQRDRWLNQYDTLIVDEAHERSLNIDFLLGYLRQLLPRRPELKLIITSATIDTERFAAHFDDAPVIEVSGRSHPVEVRYRAPAEEGGADLIDAIAAAVDELDAIDPLGDMLVFLPGERDIREALDALTKLRLRHTEVLPLFARLGSQAQNRIFHPGKLRRIILTTNVAETSLTVPRIKFVIDSGLARISRYSHRSKVQRLPIEAVSQASAQQRAGRCGRLGPGVCIRLYDEADFAARPQFTEPEIVRTNLASVILQMAQLKLGQVEQFPFIDAPDTRLINDGYQLLFELTALDADRQLTKKGREMARWPLDVRLARLLIAATTGNCLTEAVVLAAGLAIADPRERPLDTQQQADQAHAHWHDPRSDFSALIALWRDYESARSESSQRQLKHWCQQRFLNAMRMREWGDLQRQLIEQLSESGHQLNSEPASYEAVHRSVVAAFVGHVSLKDEHEYIAARNRRIRIFPGSGLFKKGPRWMISALLVETAQVYARTNAQVEPQWVEQAAAHLVKRRIFDPYWSKRAGKALGYEQITLFGLPLVNRRRIDYGRDDPQTAHQLLLLDGLARGQLQTKARFLKHNLRLSAQLHEQEVRQRRHDLLIDDEQIAQWYAQRVPSELHTAAGFERWRTATEPEHSKLLFMEQADLLRPDTAPAAELFPAKLTINGANFGLRYRFEPGHVNDGVTIRVPLHLLNVLDTGALQWLVPGLLRDKVIALIKTLPKPLRRNFVPVPDCADRFVESVSSSRGLHRALADYLTEQSGQPIEEGQLDPQQLPAHLLFNVHLLDGAALLAGSRDLAALQRQYGEQARDTFFDQAGASFNRDNLSRWDFGELPQQVTLEQGLVAFPALVDQQDCVGLRLFDDAAEARAYHRAGLARLLRLTLKDKFRYFARSLNFDATTRLYYATIGRWQELRDDLIDALALAVVDGVEANVYSPAQFERLLIAAREQLGTSGGNAKQLLEAVLASYHRLRLQLEADDFQALYPWAFDDIHSQLSQLFYPGFVADVGLRRLTQYPRYFEALELRVATLADDPSRDQARQRQLGAFWEQYLEALAEGSDAQLQPYRWLLEEYRVSLFAQRLKTAEPVSAKRLNKLWRELTG